MEKAFIFGTGVRAREIIPEVRKKYVLQGFLDNDPYMREKQVEGLAVHSVEAVMNFSWDKIVIATISADVFSTMMDQLLHLGIDRSKIDTSYYNDRTKARAIFLESFARMSYERKIGVNANVAEAGVFQGDFSKEINRVFPDKKLYLFDTFEGFTTEDLEIDSRNCLSEWIDNKFSITSEQLVMEKMQYPENCIIKKGRFPYTAKDIEERFCFVSLDMDLYNPTLEGLIWFSNHMCKNGVVIVHDYFSILYRGVKKAVDEFLETRKDLFCLPFGDGISVCICGYQ